MDQFFFVTFAVSLFSKFSFDWSPFLSTLVLESPSVRSNLPIKRSTLVSASPDSGFGFPSSPILPISVQYQAPTLVKKPVLQRTSFFSWRAWAGGGAMIGSCARHPKNGTMARVAAMVILFKSCCVPPEPSGRGCESFFFGGVKPNETFNSSRSVVKSLGKRRGTGPRTM